MNTNTSKPKKKRNYGTPEDRLVKNLTTVHLASLIDADHDTEEQKLKRMLKMLKENGGDRRVRAVSQKEWATVMDAVQQ